MTQAQSLAARRFPSLLCGVALLLTAASFGWLMWTLYALPQDAAGFATERFQLRSEFSAAVASALAAGALLAALAIGAWVYVLLSVRRWRAALLESGSERERADARARESEERLGRIFETAPGGIIVVDRAGRITFANAAAEAILGVTRAQVAARAHNDPAWGITAASGAPFPDDKLPFAQIMLTNQPVYVEYAIGRPDGSRATLGVTAAPLRDGSGQPAGMVASLSDITERRQADEKLREGERFLNNVFASIQDGISVLDMDMRIIRVNRTMEQWYAHAMPLVGRKCHEAYHGRGERCEVCPTWRTIQTGETAHEVVPKTGQKRQQSGWLDLYSFPLVDRATGKVRGVIEYVRDITERRQAEEALRQSEEHLRQAQRLAHFGSWRKDLRTNAVWWSEEYYRILGLQAADAAASEESFLSRVHPDERASVVARIRRLCAQGGTESHEFRITRPDGELRHLSCTVAATVDAAGHPGELLGVVVDVTEQRKAEEALRQSEKRYRAVVEDQTELICRFRPDGALTFVNDVYCRCFSKEAEELVGHTFMPLVHEDDRVRVSEALASLSREQPTCAVEERVFTPSGEMRWQQWTNRAIFDTQGRIVECQAVGRDITERKQAEEALRESEEHFRTLLQSLQTGVLVIDAETHAIADANPAALRMIGAPREAVVGRVCHSFVCPAEKGQCPIADLRQTVDRSERVLLTASGETRAILKSVDAMVLKGRRHLIESFVDITERKQAEEALRESEQKYSALVETTQTGFLILDAQGRVVDANAEYVRLTGHKALAEILGRTVAEWTAPHDRERNAAEVAKCAATGRVRDLIVDYAGPNGVITPIEINATVVQTAAGTRILSLCRDITRRRRAEQERRRLQEQMQHAQKLESLGVLAGGIAHDFNNILAVILGNADMALLKLSPASPARENIQDVEKASLRAADLCKQMLAYSGKGRFIIQPLNLSEIVHEMGHLLEVSISRNTALRYNFAPNLPLIEADATQMQQVVMNLITNASEALGDKPGVVAVSTGVTDCTTEYLREAYLNEQLPGGQYVYLEVADTGCGMTKETLQRIFEPFFTTKFTGRGLGLSAVLGIIRGHRGAIKVYSEPGRGTTFKVLFPVGKPLTETQKLKRATAQPWRGHGVLLLVDDDANIRAVGKAMLDWAGFTVLTAANGREAVDVFRKHATEIACVILDLSMPGADGEAAFRELRAFKPDVRVLMSSGYNEQEVTQRFVGRGLAGFIQKPYTADLLIAKVREVLGQ